MPFDFELPEDLLRHLGIDYYRIHTGVYKTQEDNEYIMVDVWKQHRAKQRNEGRKGISGIEEYSEFIHVGSMAGVEISLPLFLLIGGWYLGRPKDLFANSAVVSVKRG